MENKIFSNHVVEIRYKPNPKGRGGKGGLSYLYSLK